MQGQSPRKYIAVRRLSFTACEQTASDTMPTTKRRRLIRLFVLLLPSLATVLVLTGLLVSAAKASTTIGGNNPCAQVVTGLTGEVVTDDDDCLVAFKSGSGDWTVPTGITEVDYLVVGGGGGGGVHGGGGAGAMLEAVDQSVVPGSDITVSIGGGGVKGSATSAGSNGGHSSFDGVFAYGGGGGSSTDQNAADGRAVLNSSFVNDKGGSGGGGMASPPGVLTSCTSNMEAFTSNIAGGRPSGSADDGFRNGGGGSTGVCYNFDNGDASFFVGGGGGGAGETGFPVAWADDGETIDGVRHPDGTTKALEGLAFVAGAGGSGLPSDVVDSPGVATALGIGHVVGTQVYFAGGGAGGGNFDNNAISGTVATALANSGGYFGLVGHGGIGGGGSSGAGVANTGGGGGGWRDGDGGSGVVVVRYTRLSQTALTITPSTVALGAPVRLTASGGSGTGALTFTGSGNCSVSGDTLTPIGIGTCTVTATKAADASYTAASTTLAITITSTPACSPTESSFVGDGTNGTDGLTYEVRTFDAVGPCVWQAPAGVTAVDYLVVGGGGGGGRGHPSDHGGGGGGGGQVSGGTVALSDTIDITVGAGGSDRGSLDDGDGVGSESVLGAVATAAGGGGGAFWDAKATTGASGGGGAAIYGATGDPDRDEGAAGTSGQGNDGGAGEDDDPGNNGGGGGGFGSAGNDWNASGDAASRGGAGFTSLITGASRFYGAGGGGGRGANSSGGGGTLSGPGSGGGINGDGGAGQQGSGGGGGGGSGDGASGQRLGGDGGSGVVIVRWAATPPAITIVASGGADEGDGWASSSGVIAATRDVSIDASDVEAAIDGGAVTVQAGSIHINASIDTAGADLEFVASRITQPRGVSVQSGGGNIAYSITNSPWTADADVALLIGATGSGSAAIDAEGGDLSLSAGFAASGTNNASNDDADVAVRIGSATLRTSGTGAVSITGDASNNASTVANYVWGVVLDPGTVIGSATGDITVTGTAGTAMDNARGIASNGTDLKVVSESGEIRLTDARPVGLQDGVSYTGMYLKPSSSNIFFGADGSEISSSSSDIVVAADRLTLDVGGDVTFDSSGSLTIRPVAKSFDAPLSFANYALSGLSSLTLGKPGNTSNIELNRAITIAGPITLYSDSLLIDQALTATNDRVSLIAASPNNLQGTLELLDGGSINADELLVQNFHMADLRTKGTLSANTLASEGISSRLLILNDKSLMIGTVDGVDGVTMASGFTIIETTTGDLSLTQPVVSTAGSGSAITLNSGVNQSVGTAAGGDIVVSGAGDVRVPAGARARLFSGSPAASTGLAALADRRWVFYDETSDLPDLALGEVHALYRQTTADRLRLDPEPSATAASGVALTQQPIVAIVDAFDNVIRTDDETQIAVSIFTGDNGTLQGTTAQAVTEGQVSYTDLGVLGPVGQAYRLRFTSPGLSAVTSDPVTLTAPGPLDLTASVLSADPVGNVTADGQSQSFLTATLTDTYGNPRPNEAVVLALNETEGRALGQTSGQTNAIGQFTTPLTSTVTGVTTVKAYSNSADPANEVDTVGVGFIADEPTQIELVSGDGQTGEVATALDNPLTVRVLDAFDNVVEGASVAFTGDGTTDPVKGVVVTDGQGIASVDWTLGEQAGEQALQATLAGSDPEQSVTFQAIATAGPPAQWAFEWETFKQLTTIPFDLTVVLQDAFANPTTAETDLTVAIGATNASADNSIAGASDGDFTFDGTTNPVTGTLPAGETALALSEVVYSGLSAPDVETPDIELAATATLGGETLSGTGLISARDIQLVVAASPNKIVADGAEQSLITSTLLDLDDNPIANQPVRFENTLGELLDADSLEVLDQPVVLTGDANGQAQVVFRSQQASSAKVLTTSRGADPFELLISLVEDIDPAAVAALTAEERPSDPEFGLEVYQDAGIEEATEDNLPAYNSALANLSLDADGVEAMVLAYNTVLSQAQTGSVALTEAQYAQLGITLSSREAVLLMNSILSAQGIDALKDHSRLLEIARIVQSLLDRRAGETEVTNISADDLVLIGLQGVNSRNAGFIVGALSDPSTSGAALTLAQMQTLVTAASEDFQALPIPTTHPWALWVLMVMLLGLDVSQTRRLRAHP